MARVAVVGVGAIGAAMAAAVQSAGGHELLLCARRPLERVVVELPDGSAVVACPGRCSPIPRASTGRPTGCCWRSRPTRRRAPRAGCRRCAGRRARSSPCCRTASTTSSASAPLVGDAQVLPVVNWCPVEPVAPGRVRQRDALRLAVPAGAAGEGLAALLGDHAEVTVGGAFELEAWRKLCANAVSGVMALAGRPAEIFALDDVREVARALAHECAAVARAEGVELTDARRRRRHRLARGAAERRRLLDPHRPPAPAARWSGRRATA